MLGFEFQICDASLALIGSSVSIAAGICFSISLGRAQSLAFTSVARSGHTGNDAETTSEFWTNKIMLKLKAAAEKQLQCVQMQAINMCLLTKCVC